MSEPEKTYRSTLNLPQTAFPMKADLVKKEPETLKKWQEEDLYHAILKKNEGRPKFVLHDGPPYANGSIHFGHILNKVLKDIIVKYKNMAGFQSPYVPGWDCHGLPIEHQVDKELGAKKKDMDKLEIRKACREYAMKYVDLQREEFRRFGIFGEWDKPYLTMSYDYEATIAREFGRFVGSGEIYKGLKPVLWCPRCRTALAEAEVEHEEHESPSIYVRFPYAGDAADLHTSLKGKKVSIVIWTTTPWTIPANLAVALHANYDYVFVPLEDEYVIIAKNLTGAFFSLLGKEEPEPLDRFSGKKLEGRKFRHPFLDREVPIILSDHVSLDTGTGCVHIAPGHGQDDHEVGLRYGLEILTPVDHAGRYTDKVGIPEWVGTKVFDANPLVIQKLQQVGALAHASTIRHMYPHCWRCKNPVIFRATEQWFLSLSKYDLRGKALDAIRRVQWIPNWGRERIYGMIEKRPDWCLSRQRSWGVPILAFRCAGCNHLLVEEDLIQKIAERFEKEGSDVWFAETADNLLPKGTACPSCHGTQWTKEEDILDVWFDSGVSFAAVLEKSPALKFPADLYLEGSDQHRGWFHSSLLASVGTRGKAPYQAVLTHGFVVDGEGRKYSKSARNYVPPDKALKENGAEILRLWVSAEDYRNDIRISTEILTRLVEAYRKIRNTARYLLGNLYDYDSSAKFQFREIDLWALYQLQKLILKIRKAYDELEFHVIFHELNRFCTVELSSFYLDILKDRLYTFPKNHPERRGAQKVLFEIATTVARLTAPILSFTAEEVWQYLPLFEGKSASVHLADFPEAKNEWIDEALASRWKNFRMVRDEILKALEKARQAKVIGNALEAKVMLIAGIDAKDYLKGFENSLPELLIVSQASFGLEIPKSAWKSEAFPTLWVDVAHADGQKCERCWTWNTFVGTLAEYPTLCQRCVEAVKTL